MVVLSDVRVSRLEILDLRLAGYVRYTILATSDAVVMAHATGLFERVFRTQIH